VIAYKFLRPGAVGPFSGFAWPVPGDSGPGEWVGASTDEGACRDGVHACGPTQLPFWIWEELWKVELDGPVEEVGRKLRARRGRLVERVDAWSPESAKAFAVSCARRAARQAAGPLSSAGHDEAAAAFAHGADPEAVRALTAELWDALPTDVRIPIGMASDGALRALTARASDDAYVSAHGSAVCAYIATLTALRVGGQRAVELERAWQADWLGHRLGVELTLGAPEEP
jgi:hypothetical protein